MREKFNLCPSSSSQPSFLTSHQNQDPVTAVSIPLSASTHFRAISDTGPPSLTIYAPQPGETAAQEGGKEAEESKTEARVKLTTESGDGAGGQQGSSVKENIAYNVQKRKPMFMLIVLLVI